ncbi:PREDICTED: pentatricopeptide repeat-containing protein At4g28010-like [Fragaria vesca subsp. vesca]
MRTANSLPSVVSFNTIIDGILNAGDVNSAKELLEDMFKLGLTPDKVTFSTLVNRFAKLGLLDEARMCVEKMIARGIEPDVFVFDSLLKGYISNGETEEIVNLLHQMADKGVNLDKEITSTILVCLCQISDNVDVMEVLPNFSRETSNGISITCNELLMKVNKSYPELKLCAA